MFVKRKKDKLIQIRVTEEEKEIIKKLADKNKLSVSEFLLLLVSMYIVSS